MGLLYVRSVKGLIIAITILGLWLLTLSCLLGFSIQLDQPLILLLILLAIIWQTFLYTGLFITAHEAMHGLVCPAHPTLNRLVGILAISLYAFFSYDQFLQKHWLHHRYPASCIDPDFHNGQNTSLFAWYGHFLTGYWSWQSVFTCVSVVVLVSYIFHISFFNIILFWLIPLILSSLQLFYFGTFLPHRPSVNHLTSESLPQTTLHQTNSTDLPVFLSFITCYHFGYHREHHEHPQVPWWELPKLHNQF
jgi:beta-carotene ketolase (CrtW type)